VSGFVHASVQCRQASARAGNRRLWLLRDLQGAHTENSKTKISLWKTRRELNRRPGRARTVENQEVACLYRGVDDRVFKAVGRGRRRIAADRALAQCHWHLVVCFVAAGNKPKACMDQPRRNVRNAPRTER
jgi:hypothetical protein